jgi:hypothetical protein
MQLGYVQIKTITETNSIKQVRRSACPSASRGERHKASHVQTHQINTLPANAMSVDSSGVDAKPKESPALPINGFEAQPTMVQNGLGQATIRPYIEEDIEVIADCYQSEEGCDGDGQGDSYETGNADGEGESSGYGDVSGSVAENGNGDGNSHLHAWKQRSAARNAMGGPRHRLSAAQATSTASVVFVRNRRPGNVNSQNDCIPTLE